MNDKAIYRTSILLNPGQTKGLRILPWEEQLTHLVAGTKVTFRAEVRTFGAGTARVRIHDLYQAVPQPGIGSFNPSGPVRMLDRDLQDTVNLVDESTQPDVQQGFLLWEEVGLVDQIKSPEVSRTTDQTNSHEFLVEVENPESLPLFATVELYFDF